MVIKPEDIDSKQFSTTRVRGGYLQKEVDDFLDRLRDDYATLRELYDRAESRSASAVTKVENAAPSLDSVARLLDVAKAHADQLVNDAVADGESIKQKARQEAASLAADARAEAARVAVVARQEADQIKGAAHVAAQDIRNTHAGLETAIGELQAKRDHLYTWVKAALDDFGKGGPDGTTPAP